MAFNIPMSLIEDHPDYVVYEYYNEQWETDRTKPPFSKERMRLASRQVGRISFNKKTQEFTQLAGQDWDTKDTFCKRACIMVLRQVEKGSWPAEMIYQA